MLQVSDMDFNQIRLPSHDANTIDWNAEPIGLSCPTEVLCGLCLTLCTVKENTIACPRCGARHEEMNHA